MSADRTLDSPLRGPIIRAGLLRKLKTMKKKYFVLRGEAPGCPACLEYYDNKKKFENKQAPKRSIALNSCFNINKRNDTKHKYVIALYTKDECFCLILDTEKDLQEWLKSMLLLQNGKQPDGEQPRPAFEHIWQVTLQKKGLGERKNMHGPYRLCLTDRILSLVKIGAKDKSDILEFSLISIRRCGYVDRIFYMEVGRSAVTGGGEFWMEAEDHNIARNMHDAIYNAMSNSGNKDEVTPRQRMRSCSANEASKPISVLQRRHTGQKLHGLSLLEEQATHKEQVDPLREQAATVSVPSQCCQSQSTSSSNALTAVAGVGSGSALITSTNANCAVANRRRHSVASHPHSVNNPQSAHANISSSSTTTTTTTTTITPTTTTTTPVATATTTTTTATISHQRTLSLPLAAVVISQTQSSKRSVLRCTSGRDRCDSLPSRARTTSEGHPIVLSHPRAAHFVPHVPRPHSMHVRGLSYSPPVSSMPISPASGACSTDSAGSSLSMDDGHDNILEEGSASRYGHSLTPDEPVILEENGDDYASWSNNHQQKYSPNFKSHSPSQQQSSYVEMYSPSDSSPGRGGVYMQMSPATTAHSRGSSIVEETTLPDGYVPMAPVGDDGYVDMDPANSHNSHNGHFPDDISQHGGSSCSVTSGTPSTDLRFSEYHLDKVTSFLAPSEDLQARPTRAYSVGSSSEPANRHRKNRLDLTQQDASRVRAFSVGSRSKRPEIGRLASVITAPLMSSSENSHSNKSNSAPLLSSSWGHNSGCSGASDRMEDLMEFDFTKPSVPTTVSSPPQFFGQSSVLQSTATDTSSYVDMSLGSCPPFSSSTASYADVTGGIKGNRNNNNINNNNNNNTTTANYNHNHIHSSAAITSHKSVITTLKPVEEAEGPYLQMVDSLEDWSRIEQSPKQVTSPLQEDYMDMNGPPGGTRTAPVDFPQPRKPPEGYVEMSFKGKSSLEQDYMNMNMSTTNSRNNRRQRHNGNQKDKSRSQPIAIQSKPVTTVPNFLPLNGSPDMESLASTPASPPQATPTGSSATIFPFSLNSPQSPIKSFAEQEMKEISNNSSLTSNCDFGSTAKKNCSEIDVTSNEKASRMYAIAVQQDPVSPLAKRLSEVTMSKSRLITTSPVTTTSSLTSVSGFKSVQSKPASPKQVEDPSTPTSTPTPTPSPLDTEGYEKLQPGATILHYASLDLPESSSVPPVSPTPAQESFNYAEIDFAKLKQA